MTTTPPPGENSGSEPSRRSASWLSELASPTGSDQRSLLADAVGGRRGLIDSGLPPLVFVVAFLISGRDLRTAVIAAVASGAAVAVWRLIRRQSLQQIIGGFLGVALSAWIASRTGQAEDFFLPGLIINMVYGLVLLISVVIGHPLIGHLVALLGGPASWRRDPVIRSRMARATWLWVGVFWLRMAVQLPLYQMGAVAALGVARVAMGLPLYLVAVWLTWRMVRPVMRASSTEEPPASV